MNGFTARYELAFPRLVRVEPQPEGYDAWARSVDEKQLYLSVLTLGRDSEGCDCSCTASTTAL